ncbi:MAG: outer membrane protein assembly factor BamA [Phycisphaerae bacterium]|jgi:outer membrane protein insertion porin family
MERKRPALAISIALWVSVMICFAFADKPASLDMPADANTDTGIVEVNQPAAPNVGEQLSRIDERAAGLNIGRILVAGNRSVTDSQVFGTVRSRVGMEFSPVIAEEDAKRIARLPGVEYSYYNTTVADSRVELTFVVVERNIVRAIVFTGNEEYKPGQLVKELDFKLGDYLDPIQASMSVTTLVEFYKSKGFPFVEVSLDTERLSDGRVIYNITEGPRVKISDVEFEGNKKLKSKDLKKVVKVRPKKFVVFTRYYVEDEVVKDVTNLQNVYFERGFLDSKIEPELQFSEDKKSAVLVFHITEGEAYTVDDINLTGITLFDEAELRKKLKLEVGKIYNDRKAEADVEQLVSDYRETGFIDAEVEKKREYVGEDKVAVEYEVKPGSRFKIGRIHITGNKDTQDSAVRNVLDEFDFKPGQWYNADTAKGDGTGYLEKLIRNMTVAQAATVTPTGNDPNYRDAIVNITEGQTGMILLGAGVGSDSGVIGQLVFEQRNFDISDKPKSLSEIFTGKAFKGAGQTFRIALEPGTEMSRYSVSFSDPYWRDKPISMDLAGSSFARGRESYDEERIKGFLGFEKRYKNKWRRSITTRVEQVDLVDLDIDAPLEVRDEEGKSNLFGLRFGTGKDMRNDRYDPTDGYTFDVGYEQVGGDYTFGIADVTYRYYKTLAEDLAGNKTVMGVKLLGATTVGNAPIFEKFYAGGNGTYGIRGFEYRGVSPRAYPYNIKTKTLGTEKEDPIGSKWIFLANSEVTIPLGSPTFSMLFFVDSGMVEEGGYRASVGTGLQIMIPQWFGPVPMRFEIATPVMKDGDDDTQVFSFSVGRLY